jgi:hypothetical protein
MNSLCRAFDPESVNGLADLVRELENELTDDAPLNHVTRAALARRVIHFANEGERDRARIKELVLNRPSIPRAF